MPTLGYWKTRGLAQPIRLLLTYVGEEFEDVMYEQGEAPGFSRESWYSVKPQFGEFLDFPNLPYYLDGDVKITQSNAILKHIARKHKMDGETETERATVDMLLDQQYDFRSGYSDVTYSKHFEDLKDGYIKNVLSQLPLYEKKLGDHPWFVGEKHLDIRRHVQLIVPMSRAEALFGFITPSRKSRNPLGSARSELGKTDLNNPVSPLAAWPFHCCNCWIFLI